MPTIEVKDSEVKKYLQGCEWTVKDGVVITEDGAFAVGVFNVVAFWLDRCCQGPHRRTQERAEAQLMYSVWEQVREYLQKQKSEADRRKNA